MGYTLFYYIKYKCMQGLGSVWRLKFTLTISMGMMVIFSVVVLCLGMAAQQAVCERYHIVASPSDPCPGEHNGEYCFTLQQFISESASLSVIQHLTLELEPGIHTLEFQSLYITGKNSLEVIGHNATINCSGYVYWYRLFNFQSIEQLSILNTQRYTIQSCMGH